MAEIGKQLEYMIRNVLHGVKRLDVEVAIDGRHYEISCYRVVDLVRIDIKPIERKAR